MHRALMSLTRLVGATARLAAVGSAPAAAIPSPVGTKPTKVVMIVVDALSRELVDSYDMKNVKALRDTGVHSPRGYLGHVGQGQPGRGTDGAGAGVSAVRTGKGDHDDLASPIRRDLMTTPDEIAWFTQHTPELVDTEAAGTVPT